MTRAADGGPRKRGRPTESEREQRREEILDAAVRLFLQYGYGGVSLDRLATEAKVTKRTIYGYVGDKTEVFIAAVARLNREVLPETGPVDQQTPGADALEALAVRLVITLHSDVAIGLHRMVIAEAHQFPDLATGFYAAGPQRYIDGLSDLVPCPEELFALLLGEPHRRRLLGLDAPPSRAQAEAHVNGVLELLDLAR
ncbi:TetR/AcrR family transcriptional regulator [Kribbella pittospori]|uniref:TetR/AcrR family transcriptional regulator n=1 Tax=Kribbella pittospori TaxID=722689 RepID=A0A4R0KER6_9ACTN|nr:TetR/AcrR family transcriptional regulator [Kribbella pittospori]TCC57604.1 TetR/AcrR family transcriptional regulator [Kribbella pittospori]